MRIDLRGTFAAGLRDLLGISSRVQVLPPRGQPIVVPRSENPYWAEAGWRNEGSVYKGFFRSRFGSFEGKVEKGRFFIFEPPPELQHHPHWICFNHQGNGWYFIHFSVPPRDMDSGIRRVEGILNEAFTGAGAAHGR